jgi:hypothetical protein
MSFKFFLLIHFFCFQLYLIWFGARSLDENDTSAQGETGGRLGELALRTGGEVLHVPDEAFGADGDLGLVNTTLPL